MTTYRSTKNYTQEMIRIAHKWLDKGLVKEDLEADAEQLLQLAHKIGGESLGVEFPSNTLLGSLISLLQDQDISFALIGGVAVSAHGLSRQTEDIDALVSKLPDVSNADYASKFGFYRSRSHTGTVMSIDHKQSGYVELLTPTTAIMEYALKTAKPQNVLGFSVPVIEPDALIGNKIQALVSSPSREFKDSVDILAVYKHNQPNLETVRKLLSPAENNKLDEVLGIKSVAPERK